MIVAAVWLFELERKIYLLLFESLLEYSFVDIVRNIKFLRFISNFAVCQFV